MPHSGQLSDIDATALARAASALRDDARAGTLAPLLRGRHIALLCDDEWCAAAQRLTQAAAPLGARVSRLASSLADDGSDDALRLLAQLYDAIDCEHASPRIARLRDALSLPVFEGLGSPEHALVRRTAMLMAEQGAAPTPTDEDMRSVVQALLVQAIG